MCFLINFIQKYTNNNYIMIEIKIKFEKKLIIFDNIAHSKLLRI
jgi:hypothetical protein